MAGLLNLWQEKTDSDIFMNECVRIDLALALCQELGKMHKLIIHKAYP